MTLRVSSMASPDSHDYAHTIFDAGDWALVALDKLEYRNVNEVTLNPDNHSKNLYVQNFASTAPSGRVFAALHPSTISGVAASSTCSVKPRGSETYCNVWPVELEDYSSCTILLF